MLISEADARIKSDGAHKAQAGAQSPFALLRLPLLNFRLINVCGEMFSLALKQTNIKGDGFQGDGLCRGYRRKLGENFLKSRPQEGGGKDGGGLRC